MSELSERLREQATSDHQRGCQGRCYACDCGYDLATEGLLEQAASRIEELEAEKVELQQVFDSRWEADQRAIKKWQASHPDQENIWPDHADMVVWLLARAEKAERALAEAVEVLRPFMPDPTMMDILWGDMDDESVGSHTIKLKHFRAANAFVKAQEGKST